MFGLSVNPRAELVRLEKKLGALADDLAGKGAALTEAEHAAAEAVAAGEGEDSALSRLESLRHKYAEAENLRTILERTAADRREQIANEDRADFIKRAQAVAAKRMEANGKAVAAAAEAYQEMSKALASVIATSADIGTLRLILTKLNAECPSPMIPLDAMRVGAEAVRKASGGSDVRDVRLDRVLEAVTMIPIPPHESVTAITHEYDAIRRHEADVVKARMLPLAAKPELPEYDPLRATVGAGGPARPPMPYGIQPR